MANEQGHNVEVTTEKVDGRIIEEGGASRGAQVVRVSVVGIVANILLAGFKATFGLIAHSIAIVLDAVNNLSDAASSIITIVGTKLAGKQPDRKHPFGYGRVEYLTTVIIAVIVLWAGITAATESIQRVLCAGIPIMGHLGLTPQSINKFGTYTVRAREEAEAAKLVEDARLLEELGCFAWVLEKIPADLATRVASELRIPVIGIGAGGGVDGQVLVMHDMLGINQDFSPRFLRRYADLNAVITDAVQAYIGDIKTRDFPNEKEQY